MLWGINCLWTVLGVSAALLAPCCALPGFGDGFRSEVLPAAWTDEDPYRWVGSVAVADGSGFFLGSGVVVQPYVFATAAHVVFDERVDEWLPPSSVTFEPGRHRSRHLGEGGQRAVAFHVWDSYRTRKIDDDLEPGQSSVEAFNMDFAAVYTLGRPWMEDGSYAPTFVDDSGKVSLMRQDREKTVVGYPVDEDYIDSEDRGLMHATPVDRFDLIWTANDWDPATQVWEAGFEAAVYAFFDGGVYAGNSGGPLYVRGDDGRWYVNALFVGGFSDEIIFVRNVNEAAWALVSEAARSAGGYILSRTNRPTAVVTGHAVKLSWDQRAGIDAVFVIERRRDGRFEEIDQVQGMSMSYTDRSVTPGTGYTYRITPRKSNGDQAPPSPEVSVNVPGSDLALGAALGARGLYFTTAGDATVHIQEGGIETGWTESLERSYVELSLLGPGTLAFDWRVSSERNSDFGNPQSELSEYIFDAFYFYHNGERIAFLSGEEGPFRRQVAVPEGTHVFRWEYEKDPYTDEGLDAGFLSNLTWSPQNKDIYIYGATEASGDYRRSAWFGFHTFEHFPWTYSYEHGWLYLYKAEGNDIWAYDPDPRVGWMYLAPAHFPYVYLVQDGWVYYFSGSGVGGTGRWFFIYEGERFLHIE